MQIAKVDLNHEKLQYCTELMRAVSHPLRMKILSFIDDNQGVTVNAIYTKLKLEQSITSQHLRILRVVDLVVTKKEGKFVYYTVNYDRVEALSAGVRNYLDGNAKK